MSSKKIAVLVAAIVAAIIGVVILTGCSTPSASADAAVGTTTVAVPVAVPTTVTAAPVTKQVPTTVTKQVTTTRTVVPAPKTKTVYETQTETVTSYAVSPYCQKANDLVFTIYGNWLKEAKHMNNAVTYDSYGDFSDATSEIHEATALLKIIQADFDTWSKWATYCEIGLH